jgi:hypothetical protein
LAPLEDFINLTGGLAKNLHEVDAIGHEPTGFYKRTKWVDGRQPVFLRQLTDQFSLERSN